MTLWSGLKFFLSYGEWPHDCQRNKTWVCSTCGRTPRAHKTSCWAQSFEWICAKCGMRVR